jgi:hypothetical protein
MPQIIHTLWLDESDHNLWLIANKQSHYILFAAFAAFNLLSVIAGKVATRKTPKLNAQAQHGMTNFFYTAATVAVAVYTLTHRSSPLESGCSTTRLFCYDQLTSYFLDIHAGYQFYEWIFYLRHEKIIKPRFDFSGLHRTLLLLGYALAKVHPVELTVVILPLYQLLAIAQFAEARLDLAVAFGRIPKLCLDRLKYVVIFSFLRAIGALGIAFYSWWWISSRDLIHLDLPVGKRAILNTSYSYFFVGGGFALSLLYLNWFRYAGDSQKRAYASLQTLDRTKAEATSVQEVANSGGSTKKKKKAVRA